MDVNFERHTAMKKQSSPAPRSIWSNPTHFIACGFGLGASPVAPGTVGTLAALPFYLILQHYALWIYMIAVILLAVIGTYLADKTARDFGEHDHQSIVIDEVVGYLITMFAMPQGWQWMLFGFLAFRLFDIWKPWPIRLIDKKVKGGFGIMLDDIIAAIFAWVFIVASIYVWIHFLQ